jgi:MoaA/NifB/PqqE/SkfB family radical SAM enzyme
MKPTDAEVDEKRLCSIQSVIELLPAGFDRELASQVLETMYSRPYLPSSHLVQEYDIGVQDLKVLYSTIRGSEKAMALFGLCSYPFLIGLLDSLSKDSVRTLAILQGKTPSPLFETLELFISEACNANCKFCYRSGKNYGYPAKMSIHDYVRLINDFADCGGKNLDVSGGLEPLLSPAVFDVLQTGIDRGLNIGLYTNGIALNGSRIVGKLLKIGRVRVSLNAYDRRSYADIMGVDAFDRVVKNIKELIQARANAGSKVKIGASFVVCDENYKQIYKVIELAQHLEIDYLGLRYVEVTDSVGSNKDQQEEISSSLQRIRYENSLKRFGKLNISVADTFNEAISSRDYLNYFWKDLIDALSYYRITVTPSGKVYALNLIGQPSREDTRYLLGDLTEGVSLSDIVMKKRSIPYSTELLLAHDFSLMLALSKLKSDLEFGVELNDNPFNWAT